MKKKDKRKSLLTIMIFWIIPYFFAIAFITRFSIEAQNILNRNRENEKYFQNIVKMISAFSSHFLEVSDTEHIDELNYILNNFKNIDNFYYALYVDSSYTVRSYIKAKDDIPIEYERKFIEKSLSEEKVIEEFQPKNSTDNYYYAITSDYGGEKRFLGGFILSISRKSFFKIMLSNSLKSLLIVGLVSIILLFIIFHLYKRIVNPIILITKELKMINEGKSDLKPKDMTIPYREYIGLILEFNKIFELLYTIRNELTDATKLITEHIELLSSSSEELTASSEEITSSIQEISHNSYEQAKKMEEVYKGTKETKNIIVSSFEMIKKNEEFSTKINLMAKKGKEISENSSRASEMILSSSNELYKTIKDITEKQEKISLITETIKAITNRTNILSLNASIEAARAGEYGKGFQVVAEEIRKLAEKSQESAISIHEIIEEINEAIKILIEKSKSNEEIIVDGKNALTKTFETLEEISNNIENINENNKNATNQIKTVKESMELFSKTINEILKISENNASASEEITSAVEQEGASIEELASSTQHLYTTAGKLKDIVERFKKTS